ncbi:MAG TPA: RseA family anti-sigma factor [Steroidobacteraceae bacterium]|nr:RseA family anti-sigma factor [Steroidobacteraceae bacterium]HQX46781.1 RseA family anti-sigma factor [Steroidobacteraceae bacterium]HQX77708.1 RseA family anti-sigma factor [Steroidobacteraceae bacterium]HQZ79950.1 RseA family anti-sigma factor [Steroidobacteraceae bacterium]
MNEEQQASQLSAMFDGELPPGECELLARRLTRDGELRAQWARYAIIGAAMRREPGVSLDLRVAERVRLAVSAEASFDDGNAPVAGAPAVPGTRRWLRPVAGFAAAAVVAGIAVIGLRGRDAQLSDPVPGPMVASVPAPAAPRVLEPQSSSEPESYVVPVSSEPLNFVPPARLANYVVAHSEVSMPLTRRNLLSALMANEQDDGAPAVTTTDAAPAR